MGAVSASFWDGVLMLCKAPFTANLVDILNEWQRYEGGGAAYNPLNVTVPLRGATPYNTFGDGEHVYNYPSSASGASATAMTLLNGHYPAVLAALRENWSIGQWSTAPVPAEIDVWGTHGFAAYLRLLTPEQEDEMTPQQAMMLQQIWEAIYTPVPIFGGEPTYTCPPNNIDIIRRSVAPYNKGYPPATGYPPTPPTS